MFSIKARLQNPQCPAEVLRGFHGRHSRADPVLGRQPGISALSCGAHSLGEEGGKCSQMGTITPAAVCAPGHTVAAGKDQPQCRVAAPGWHLGFSSCQCFPATQSRILRGRVGDLLLASIWELLQQKSIPCDKGNPALLKVRQREFFRSAGEYWSGFCWFFFFFSGCLAVISSRPSTQNNWEVKAQQISPGARWPGLGHYWGVKWIMVWNKPIKTNTLQSQYFFRVQLSYCDTSVITLLGSFRMCLIFPPRSWNGSGELQETQSPQVTGNKLWSVNTGCACSLQESKASFWPGESSFPPAHPLCNSFSRLWVGYSGTYIPVNFPAPSLLKSLWKLLDEQNQPQTPVKPVVDFLNWDGHWGQKKKKKSPWFICYVWVLILH